MADSGAWDAGWNLGSNLAAHRTARKEALSDYELQGKAQMYATELTNLQQKISSLPKDSPEYKQTFSAIQDTLKSVRELFHPQTNPSAVAKFGHLITDALKITSSEQRKTTQDQKQAVASAGDARQAQGLVAAAPLSPEQTYASQVNAQLKVIDDSGMSDENKERAREGVFKIYQKPNNIWLDLPDGTTQMFDKNDPSSFPPGSKPHQSATVGNEKLSEYEKYKAGGGTDTIDTWEAKQKNAVKPPTAVAVDRDSYRLSHNIPPGQPLTWAQTTDFLSQYNKAKNPLGPIRIGMEREGLDLREREANVKDTLALQKQLTPLERVINTSTEADGYVSNPTGPGDVALTLAFFDAIKTTGVRFTKQEQDFITGSRGVMDAAQASFDKGFEGTVFGPPGSPQRAIIAGIVKRSADFSKQQKNALVGGVGAFNPKAAAAATGVSLPPAARAQLKEGHVTTFSNGQKWTLKNGQPEQVQQ